MGRTRYECQISGAKIVFHQSTDEVVLGNWNNITTHKGGGKGVGIQIHKFIG